MHPIGGIVNALKPTLNATRRDARPAAGSEPPPDRCAPAPPAPRARAQTPSFTLDAIQLTEDQS